MTAVHSRPLYIPTHCADTLKATGNVTLATTSELSAFLGGNVDKVRSHLHTLENYGYVRSEYYGTPLIRSASRWWATERGYRALIESADYPANVAIDRAGLAQNIRRPDTTATLVRVMAQTIPHVPDAQPVYVEWCDTTSIDCLLHCDSSRFMAFLYTNPVLPRPRVWARLKEWAATREARACHTVVLTHTMRDRDVVLSQLRRLKLPSSVGILRYALPPISNAWRSMRLDPTSSSGMTEEWWWTYKELAEKVAGMHWDATKAPVVLNDLEAPMLAERTTPVRGIASAPGLQMPPLAKRLLALLHDFPLSRRASIQAILNISSSQLSEQLSKLRRLRLVATEYRGGVQHCLLTDTGIKYVGDEASASSQELPNRLSPQHVLDEQGRRVRKGRRLRRVEANFEHDSLVTEAAGSVSSGLHKSSDWRVLSITPPDRGRIDITVGRDAQRVRTALRSWDSSADRRTIDRQSHLIIFPDATLEIATSPSKVVTLLLEVELASVTPQEWVKRLDRYVMHALLRSSGTIPLFVVPDWPTELTVLKLQTQWVRADTTRPWPVAVTTVRRLRARGAASSIWRVYSGNKRMHSLRSLPRLLPRATTKPS